MERNILVEMSFRTKKARLDKSDEEEFDSDQDISVHASYRDELGFSSPREERGDTGKLICTCEVGIYM